MAVVGTVSVSSHLCVLWVKFTAFSNDGKSNSASFKARFFRTYETPEQLGGLRSLFVLVFWPVGREVVVHNVRQRISYPTHTPREEIDVVLIFVVDV